MKAMRFLGELLIWGLAGLAIFATCSLLFWPFVPIRFTNWQLRNEFFGFVTAAGPLAGFIAKLMHYAMRESKGSFLVHLMAAGFLLLAPVFLSFIINFTMDRTWVDDELLFVHKTENKRVIYQEIPTKDKKRIVLIRPISPDFELMTKVDTSSLSKNEWKEVLQKEPQIAR